MMTVITWGWCGGVCAPEERSVLIPSRHRPSLSTAVLGCDSGCLWLCLHFLGLAAFSSVKKQTQQFLTETQFETRGTTYLLEFLPSMKKVLASIPLSPRRISQVWWYMAIIPAPRKRRRWCGCFKFTLNRLESFRSTWGYMRTYLK